MASLLVGCVCTSTAAAHLGLGPVANQIVVDSDDDRNIAVSTSFGIVRSRDGGMSWEWTCAEAFGAQPFNEEPPLVFVNGELFAATFFDGVARAPTSCEPAFAAGTDPIAERYVPAFLVLEDSIYAVTSDGAQRDNGIFRSADGGGTFALFGDPVGPVLLESIHAEGEQLIVAGTLIEPGAAERSGRVYAMPRSGGAASEVAVVELRPSEYAFKLLRVEGERMWATAKNLESDRLFYTEGSDFEQILEVDAIDGMTRFGERYYVAAGLDGLLRSDDGRTFAPSPAADDGRSALCAERMGDKLVVCSEAAQGEPLLMAVDEDGYQTESLLELDDSLIDSASCECDEAAEAVRATLATMPDAAPAPRESGCAVGGTSANATVLACLFLLWRRRHH